MAKAIDGSEEKGNEILRQMREDSSKKVHLDQALVRAQAALKRAIDGRDEQAFMEALAALGITPGSAQWDAHLRGFGQLPKIRY